jgi:hypothetical protein
MHYERRWWESVAELWKYQKITWLDIKSKEKVSEHRRVTKAVWLIFNWLVYKLISVNQHKTEHINIWVFEKMSSLA